VARVKPAQITDELNDIWRLVVGYAKQETISPLRGVANFMRFGFAGMVCFAIGSAFASLAILRGLQYETTLDGNWSFVPYLVSIVGCLIVLGLAVRSVSRTPWKTKDKGDTK
jgi:hypothetical protein